MSFELLDLPYSHDSLSDLGMSKETLEYHHDLHHKAYVDNGNKLISGTDWENKSIEEIITGNYDKSKIVQNGIFNNASQHWNHNQFWEMMGTSGKTIPTELEKSLIENFQSIENFKEQFIAAGVSQFGSGWCWLVKNKDQDTKKWPIFVL